jgi:hypothetical protein
MSTAFSSTSYTDITVRINELNEAAEFIHITIYEDAASTLLAKDTNGNEVNSKQLTSVGYTYPDTDESTGSQTTGFLTISFVDDSSFVVIDMEVPQFWYTIVGAPITWN